MSQKKRDKAVSTAYLRLLGKSQVEVSEIVGISTNTISAWERAEWWPLIRQEAADRWMSGLAAKARVSLESAIKTDGKLSLAVLERLEPALAPAKARQEVSINNNVPQTLVIRHEIVDPKPPVIEVTAEDGEFCIVEAEAPLGITSGSTSAVQGGKRGQSKRQKP
jgi:predicted HicB family RNase H-like nuclease